MISLILPPKSQVAQTQAMLANEYGTASNIKSRVNRQSVLAAITSTQQRLKLYSKVPPNGLIVYCGTVLTEDGKEKKVNVDFEPHRPINTSLYLCDNKFHTEALGELLEADNKYGFIVMDGSGSLFGTLCGNNREVLHKVSVDLPKKHGRGGQSALRFARLRMEKRHNYVRKVAELAVQFFITNDRPNVTGLVLAGSADFKTELSQSDMFDPRLQAVILAIVDVSYGASGARNAGGWGREVECRVCGLFLRVFRAFTALLVDRCHLVRFLSRFVLSVCSARVRSGCFTNFPPFSVARDQMAVTRKRPGGRPGRGSFCRARPATLASARRSSAPRGRNIPHPHSFLACLACTFPSPCMPCAFARSPCLALIASHLRPPPPLPFPPF